MSRYEAAIVGAGPEALVASIVLARAGLRVLVLEKSDAPGGRATTLEFHPGFRASPYADELPAMPHRLYRSLGLARAGAILAPSPASVAVTEAGTSVLFANEEPPYFQHAGMGSLTHARASARRDDHIDAMLSLESLGYYAEAPGSQRYPWPIGLLYPDRADFVAFVGNVGSRALVREAIGTFRSAVSFPSEGAALPASIPGVGWSDHWSFWESGYRAVMVTDTAPYRNPNYHEPTDLPGTLDYQRLARVTIGLTHVVEHLAAVP